MADRVGVANVPAGTTNTTGVETVPGTTGPDGTALERQVVEISGDIADAILAALNRNNELMEQLCEHFTGFAADNS